MSTNRNNNDIILGTGNNNTYIDLNNSIGIPPTSTQYNNNIVYYLNNYALAGPHYDTYWKVGYEIQIVSINDTSGITITSNEEDAFLLNSPQVIRVTTTKNKSYIQRIVLSYEDAHNINCQEKWNALVSQLTTHACNNVRNSITDFNTFNYKFNPTIIAIREMLDMAAVEIRIAVELVKERVS